MIEINCWRSRAEFAEHADAWNQLWSEAQSTVALHRAEPLLAWLDAFGNDREIAIVTFRRGQQIIAGLPLMVTINRWGHRIGVSLANEWAPQSCWLALPDSDKAELILAIREACRDLRLFQLRMDWLPVDWPANRDWIQAWERASQSLWIRPRYQVSRVEMSENWEAFRGQWSRNRRKKIQQMDRNLRAAGELEFVCWEQPSPAQTTELLNLASEIEHLSWKGSIGGSLQSHPRASQYYQDWFYALAQAGLARIYFLYLNGAPIAFDLGYVAHGCYSSVKISYAPNHQELRPGEWLNVRMLEHFHESTNVQSIDCIGPATEATSRWESSRYTIGKLVLATPSWFSGTTVFACNTLASWLGKNTLPSS